MNFERESSIVGQEINFPRENRESSVRIVNEEKIGEGKFGIVSQVETDIAKDGATKRRSFVTKQFKPLDDPAQISLNAEQSLRGYNLAKEADLKVFPTYRLNKDKSMAIMTMGTRVGRQEEGGAPWVLLAQAEKSHTLQGLKQQLISKNDEPSVKELMTQLIAESRKAADKNIYVPADAYFLLVKGNQTEGHQFDYVIGDYDLITGDHERNLRKRNYKLALLFAKIVLKSNAEPDCDFEKIADEVYKEAVRDDKMR